MEYSEAMTALDNGGATPPMFLVPEIPDGDEILLGGTEGHHAARVRRIGVGEAVHVTDGVGHVVECIVVEPDNDADQGADLAIGLALEVVRRVEVPASEPRLTVVQALPKGDRGELAVELMTEAGVDRIVPWQAARCVTQWRGERAPKARRKWEVTAREATKQSRRAWQIEVDELALLADVCRLVANADASFVLHERALRPLAGVVLPGDGEIVLIVGPEGGLTDGETMALRAAGAEPVRLGREVLRTSTAGVAATAVVNAATSRWR